jgi:hypothetical protein
MKKYKQKLHRNLKINANPTKARVYSGTQVLRKGRQFLFH